MSYLRLEKAVTPEYIRNLHDPDWSQAESITAAQLTAGWTATKRGVITGAVDCVNSSQIGAYNITINSVTVSRTTVGGSGMYSNASVSSPVSPGDKIQATGATFALISYLSFVPYKQQ